MADHALNPARSRSGMAIRPARASASGTWLVPFVAGLTVGILLSAVVAAWLWPGATEAGVLHAENDSEAEPPDFQPATQTQERSALAARQLEPSATAQQVNAAAAAPGEVGANAALREGASNVAANEGASNAARGEGASNVAPGEGASNTAPGEGASNAVPGHVAAAAQANGAPAADHAQPAADAVPAAAKPGADQAHAVAAAKEAPGVAQGHAAEATSAPAHASATAAANTAAPARASSAPPASASASPAAAGALPPAAQLDPDSQDAKLAAAAQVRVKSGTEIDSLLDQAFAPGQQGSKPAPAPAPAGLPAAPTRDDVIKAMSVLVPAIRGCAQGLSGLATVTLVVRNDGHVESTSLSGAPFEGTASGRCMEGVVRRARFPRFTQSSFRVQFPYAIQ